MFLLIVGLTAAAAPRSMAGDQDQGKAKDPVCGMNVETRTAKYSTTYEGRTYYFCSESCLNKFKANPAEYVKKTAEAAKVKDPVCGMMIEAAQAKKSFAYKGKTYYFCSEDCYKKFTADPAKYVKSPVADPAK